MERDLLEVHKRNLENLLHEKKLNHNAAYDKDFLAIYTYDAISMEGKNKIPFEKVKALVANNQVSDFSDKDQKEVLNHVACFERITSLLETSKDLTEEQVKDLHELLVEDIFLGGVYRNVNIQIFGAAHQPPDFVKVYDRMKRHFAAMESSDLSYLEKGVFLHGQIAKIHPFLDGNGRLARLVLNYYLMKDGYIPISVPVSLREEYFKNIEIFKIEKNVEPLTNFVKELLNNRYESLIEKLDV